MADRICTVEGCERLHLARGLCSLHYQRCKKGRIPWPEYVAPSRPTIPLAVRALVKVERRGPDECWPWRASVAPNGYGHIEALKVDGQRRALAAHRVVYEALVGVIPRGLDLDHLCHTRDATCPGGSECPHRRCCNPAHLEPVTRSENLRRAHPRVPVEACRRGHRFDEANTHHESNGKRRCRTCSRDRARARYWKEKSDAQLILDGG